MDDQPAIGHNDEKPSEAGAPAAETRWCVSCYKGVDDSATSVCPRCGSSDLVSGTTFQRLVRDRSNDDGDPVTEGGADTLSEAHPPQATASSGGGDQPAETIAEVTETRRCSSCHREVAFSSARYCPFCGSALVPHDPLLGRAPGTPAETDDVLVGREQSEGRADVEPKPQPEHRSESKEPTHASSSRGNTGSVFAFLLLLLMLAKGRQQRWRSRLPEKWRPYWPAGPVLLVALIGGIGFLVFRPHGSSSSQSSGLQSYLASRTFSPSATSPANTTLYFIQWLESNDNIYNGQLTIASQSAVTSSQAQQHYTFTGIQNGQSLSLTMTAGGTQTYPVSGTLENGDLILNMDQSGMYYGSLGPLTMSPASQQSFNNQLTALQSAAASQQSSSQVQFTGTWQSTDPTERYTFTFDGNGNYSCTSCTSSIYSDEQNQSSKYTVEPDKHIIYLNYTEDGSLYYGQYTYTFSGNTLTLNQQGADFLLPTYSLANEAASAPTPTPRAEG